MRSTDTDAFHDGMREATRLTRAGRLSEATTLIQRNLGMATPPSTAPPSAASPRTAPAPDHDAVRVPSTVVHSERHAPRRDADVPRDRHSGARDRRAAPRRPAEPRARRGAAAPPEGRPTAPAASTGSFVSGSLGNGAGARPYKVYVPDGRHGQARALVVMLHGCTQDPDDFAAGTRMNVLADAHGLVVAYPQQTSQANPSRCWNWFKPSDQQRERGEPSIIADITREVAAAHGIGSGRIHIAGMSAGAAMAMTMATTYPDLFAAVGVHSGIPHGAAADLPSAFKVMRDGPAATGQRHTTDLPVPVIVFHGDRDRTVDQRNAEHVLRAVARGGAGGRPLLSVHDGHRPGGHAYTRYVYRDRDGATRAEGWSVHGMGHAWSGGAPAGSYTDPAGPDASAEMVRFFTEQQDRR